MAIRVDVKEYCADCFDFEADVTKPERIVDYYVLSSGVELPSSFGDTVIRCAHGRRCEGIKRYLEKRS